MNKEKVFIYKIGTNIDWYFLLNSVEFHYPYIYCYDDLEEEIIDDLNEFPSEEDFEVYKSSVSTKDKLVHYIISWYCMYHSGLFIMNDKNEVFFIIDDEIDDENLQPLSENEEDELLNGLVSKFGLESIFKETQAYYLEHNEEMIAEFRKLEEYYDGIDSKSPLYRKNERYGEALKKIKEK